MGNFKLCLIIISLDLLFQTSQVGEQKFSAHRIILAASIPYFNAMFTHDMMESKQNEITMEGIEPGYEIKKNCTKFSIQLFINLSMYHKWFHS